MQVAPNFEPALRSAARRLAPVANTIDHRGNDRADYQQILRLKVVAATAKASQKKYPMAYVHQSLQNEEISWRRKQSVGQKRTGEWNGGELVSQFNTERQLIMRDAIARLTRFLSEEEMTDLLRFIGPKKGKSGKSRSTEYRHAKELIAKARDFLESEGFYSYQLGLHEDDEPISEAPLKLTLAKSASKLHILNGQQMHAACAVWKQPIRQVQVSQKLAALCGMMHGSPMMRLQDGTLIELATGFSRPAKPLRKQGRKRQRAYVLEGENHVSSTSWAPPTYYEFSGGGGSIGSSSSAGGSGGEDGQSGGGDDPPGKRKGDGGPGLSRQTCVACSGSGKSSKGYVCHPCRGTGTRLAQNSDLPDHQHPELSGADDRQTDLFAPKAKRGNATGAAHVHGPVDAGAPTVPVDSQGDPGHDPGASVDGRPPVPGEVLRGGLPVHDEPVEGDDRPDARASDGIGPGYVRDLPPAEDQRQAPQESQATQNVQLECEKVLEPGAIAQGPVVEESKLPRGEEHGWVVDLTSLSCARVDWKGVVPLGKTPEGYNVYQLNYWCPFRQKWVWLVHQHTGRPIPDGVVEITPDEWLALDAMTYSASIRVEEWGTNHDPVLVTDKAMRRIHQVTYWQPVIQQWVIVTAKAYNRGGPAIEITIDQFFQVLRHRMNGKSPAEAFAQVVKVPSGVPA